MHDWLIMSVTREPLSTWFTVGASREQVEALYSDALAKGNFEKPIYRVIAHMKTERAA